MSAHGVKRKIDAVDFGNSTPSIGRTQTILTAGDVLSVRGFALDDGILGHVAVPAVPVIDRGGTSFIVEGRLTWIDGSGPFNVALKVLTTPMDDQQQSTLTKLIRRELAVLRTLRPHPNILPFIGTCDHDVYTIIVSPLIRNGNLLNYLQRNPAADRHQFVVQVARALCHVHNTLMLVHGDLKCENVLVSDEGNALLADFGLATGIEKVSSETVTATDIRALSTWRFNAPELMEDNVFDTDNDGRPRKRSKTSATDIYAFGMLIIQAFTEEHPWAQCNNLVQIIKAVCILNCMHPRPDARSHAVKMGFTDLHWNVCSSCWNYESRDRPNIQSVLFALCQIKWCPGIIGGYHALSLQQRPPRLTTADFALLFQTGAQQRVNTYITRSLYEYMRSQYMVQTGIMHPIGPAVEGRVVDMFELHKAYFHTQGIGRQLPDDMWQLIAGKIGFGQASDNLRSTMSTAHTIKNIYEHHLRDFDVTIVQKLLECNYQRQQLYDKRLRMCQAWQQQETMPPRNAPPFRDISHNQMSRFAALQNSRSSRIVPIQDLSEWRDMFEKLLTLCKDLDVLLPSAYKIQPDEKVARKLIDIKLAAGEQQWHYIAPLSPTYQRVLIDTKELQRFIAFISEWTPKARDLVEQDRLNASVAVRSEL